MDIVQTALKNMVIKVAKKEQSDFMGATNSEWFTSKKAFMQWLLDQEKQEVNGMFVDSDGLVWDDVIKKLLIFERVKRNGKIVYMETNRQTRENANACALDVAFFKRTQNPQRKRYYAMIHFE